ncbi:hypothetical protein OCU04_005546 [Sclerotinia nivalis]|uniref:Glycosyltransferase family 8 protein n=1 Tax=Sclerotinia nivalis TaxID=352851 RepID=A0A9X0APC3_9HELO|nr:hypothetical protein OCU04_005546 [Sclerotinia nivalis]
MFLSSRKVVFTGVSAVIVFVVSLAATYHVAVKHKFSTSFFTNTTKQTTAFIEDWTPGWTTEQLEPRFAYVQYATDMDYLCNTIINFSRLSGFGVHNDMVLIYPENWDDKKNAPREYAAVQAVRVNYPHLVMRPFEILSTTHGDATWHNSLTKFHAFALTEYTRVLAFDSDSLVLNNMDHYFLAPLAAIAVPRAYWLNENETSINDQILGSHVMLLEPNENRYKRVIQEAVSSGAFDMEVINHLFKGSAMILPHRRLALLTGEFRSTDHRKYLDDETDDEEWNAMAEVSRAYLVHFSDWPLPKPWKPRTQEQWKSVQPVCPPDDVEREDRPRCADQVMWSGFYESYDRDKGKKCGILANENL